MKRYLSIVLFLLTFSLASYATDTTCVAGVPADFKITNVITPNSDGYNDEFKVISKNLVELHVKIYDRWGMLVYSFDGINGLWDGTSFGSVLSDGVYFYVASYSTSCKPNQTITTGGYIQLLTGTTNTF